MPKDDIDYSNTIFYKIYCTNNSVSDIYVGHTTNFVQRKYYHKRACNNDRDSNHNLKVYKFIRSNGGWNNWRMDIIGFHDCDDHYQARKVEQQYFESLNATLNSIAPLPKPKEHVKKEKKEKKEKRIWQCEVCNIVCHTEKQFNIHNETKKHKQMESQKDVNIDMESGNTSNDIKGNNSKIFFCSDCDYSTSRSTDHKKHLLTKKHREMIEKNNPKHVCECGNSYNHRQSLHSHRKKCTSNITVINKKLIDYEKLLLEALEQIKKKDEIIEQMVNKLTT